MASISTSLPRRPTFAFRYRLRMLLVAITAVTIGFPIWYRWPYLEEELIYREINGQPDKSKPPSMRVVRSWQRQWGGGRLEHGTSRIDLGDGTLLCTTEFRRGKRHGIKTTFREDGSRQWIEEYADGVRVGITVYRQSGSINYEAETAGRRLHGSAEQHLDDGSVVTWRFDQGRVIARNDEPFQCGLLDALAAGAVEDGLARRLQLDVPDPVYGATPKEELDKFADECNIPIVIENPEGLEWVEPQFAPMMGINALSCLMLKTRALGRQCDYRNGQIRITLPDAEEQRSANLVSPKTQP